jgi:hypothetical protein
VNVDRVVVAFDCRSVPPDEAVYQLIVPELLLDAAITTVPVPHRDPLTAVGAVAAAYTVATTGKRALVHAGLDVVIET